MQVNFTEIVLKDINGLVAISCNFHKTIANLLYNMAKTVDFVDLAIEINKGNAVDLSVKQLQEIEELVLARNSGVFTFARKALSEFVEDKITNNSEQAKQAKTKQAKTKQAKAKQAKQE